MLKDYIKYGFREGVKEHRLGELLIKRGYITEQQLQEALNISKQTGDKIGRTLIKLGYISSAQLYSKILKQWQLRFGTIVIVSCLQLFAPAASYAGTSTSALGNDYKISQNLNKSIKKQVSYPHIFGYKEFQSDDVSSFTKWTDVIARYNKQISNKSDLTPEMAEWHNKLESFKALSPEEQVASVNKLINQEKYIEDRDNYGQNDYWATPFEFFAKGGDCEDFAITKYASLKAIGFSEDQMRIAIVKDTYKNLHHAILIVYLEGKTLILDNQDKRVEEATQVTRYQPIFSINSKHWWLHEA